MLLLLEVSIKVFNHTFVYFVLTYTFCQTEVQPSLTGSGTSKKFKVCVCVWVGGVGGGLLLICLEKIMKKCIKYHNYCCQF